MRVRFKESDHNYNEVIENKEQILQTNKKVQLENINCERQHEEKKEST